MCANSPKLSTSFVQLLSLNLNLFQNFAESLEGICEKSPKKPSAINYLLPFFEIPKCRFWGNFWEFSAKIDKFSEFFQVFYLQCTDFSNWAVTFWQLTLQIVCPTFVSLNRAEARLQFHTLDELDGGGGVLVFHLNFSEFSGRHKRIALTLVMKTNDVIE